VLYAVVSGYRRIAPDLLGKLRFLKFVEHTTSEKLVFVSGLFGIVSYVAARSLAIASEFPGGGVTVAFKDGDSVLGSATGGVSGMVVVRLFFLIGGRHAGPCNIFGDGCHPGIDGFFQQPSSLVGTH